MLGEHNSLLGMQMEYTKIPRGQLLNELNPVNFMRQNTELNLTQLRHAMPIP